MPRLRAKTTNCLRSLISPLLSSVSMIAASAETSRMQHSLDPRRRAPNGQERHSKCHEWWSSKSSTLRCTAKGRPKNVCMAFVLRLPRDDAKDEATVLTVFGRGEELLESENLRFTKHLINSSNHDPASRLTSCQCRGGLFVTYGKPNWCSWPLPEDVRRGEKIIAWERHGNQVYAFRCG